MKNIVNTIQLTENRLLKKKISKLEELIIEISCGLPLTPGFSHLNQKKQNKLCETAKHMFICTFYTNQNPGEFFLKSVGFA